MHDMDAYICVCLYMDYGLHNMCACYNMANGEFTSVGTCIHLYVHQVFTKGDEIKDLTRSKDKVCLGGEHSTSHSL